MSDSEARFSIGTISRLSGVSTHVLRKWESRHGVPRPSRSATGRRLYSQEDLEHVTLLKALVAKGYPMGELTHRPLAELQKLAGSPTATHPTGHQTVTVSGPGLAAMISAERSTFPTEIDFLITRSDPQTGQASGRGILLLELQTLSDDTIEGLSAITGYDRIIVVYDFANSQTLGKLAALSIKCIKAPITVEQLTPELHGWITGSVSAPNVAGPPPPPRFSPATVAAFANRNTAIECECPLHIAQLLSSITAFERYSAECKDADPADRDLHAFLLQTAGQSRVLFENALAHVARAEGLEFSEEPNR